jgi:hypothetical protein
LDGIRAVACRNRMQRSRGGVDLDQGVRKSAKAGPGSGTWSTGLGLLDLGCWTWLSPRIHCSKIPVAGETS